MRRTVLPIGNRTAIFVVAACAAMFGIPSAAVAQQRAYVSGELADAGCSSSALRCTRGLVSVVNTDSNQIEASIDLWRSSNLSVRDLLVNPAGNRLYAILDGPGSSVPAPLPVSTSVVVFDTATLAEVTSFTIDAHVRECAFSPDGGRLLCARDVLASDVVVVDTATHTPTATIPATYPTAIVFSPDGRRLYIHHNDNRVTVHDGATYQLLTTIAVPASGGSLAITADGSRLYASSGCSDIADIDATTNTVAGVIPGVAQGSECVIDIAFARGRAFVTVSGGMGFHEGVAVVDVASRTVLQTIGRSDFPLEAAASFDESRVFVTRYPALDIFDAATSQVLASVVLPDGPGKLALSPAPKAMLAIDVPANGQTVRQPFTLAGWAIEIPGFAGGPGIDAVHVWAFPVGGGAPIFVGVPEYGRPRPDVAAVYGASFQNSGYGLSVRGLAPGAYTVTAYGHSSRTGTFAVATQISLTVASSVQMAIDVPAAGARVSPGFVVAGWALDAAATAGTGIDAVHIWAYPTSGAAPIFAGGASLAQPRPDVAAAFGSQFALAGYSLTVQNLPAGSYLLVVYAHQAATDTYAAQHAINVTVTAPEPIIFIDTPASGATVGMNVRVAGWAIERGAVTGTGVDAVHVWAYPASGNTPVFVGAAAYGGERPDIGALFGSRYAASGFDVTGSLPPGAYTIVAYAHGTTTNTFNGVQIVRVTVR